MLEQRPEGVVADGERLLTPGHPVADRPLVVPGVDEGRPLQSLERDVERLAHLKHFWPSGEVVAPLDESPRCPAGVGPGAGAGRNGTGHPEPTLRKIGQHVSDPPRLAYVFDRLEDGTARQPAVAFAPLERSRRLPLESERLQHLGRGRFHQPACLPMLRSRPQTLGANEVARRERDGMPVMRRRRLQGPTAQKTTASAYGVAGADTVV